MTTPRSQDPLDTLLQELGPADPPAGFTDSVLAQVARTSIQPTHTRRVANVIRFGSGGIAMNISKKAMWGLAAAAALILAVFVVRGFPVVDRGTEGAIGAAKKYQAAQMSANDVVTGDVSTQEFLQSETYDRLIKDPEAVAMLSNTELRNALQQKAFADAVRNDAVRASLQNGLMVRIFSDALARTALEDALQKNLSGAELAARLNGNAALHPALKADLKNMLADANMRAALSNDAFHSSLANVGVRQALANAQMSAALSNRNFVAALGHQGFSSALRTPQFQSALSSR